MDFVQFQAPLRHYNNTPTLLRVFKIIWNIIKLLQRLLHDPFNRAPQQCSQLTIVEESSQHCTKQLVLSSFICKL